MPSLARRLEPFILIIAAFYPALLAFCYFIYLAGTEGVLQKAAYGVGKTVQFALPVIWVGFVCHESWRLRRFSARGLPEALVFAALVFAAMLGIYYGALRHNVLASDSSAAQIITDRLSRFHLNHPIPFFWAGAFYAIIHSGLEEYYWRWFLYGRLAKNMPWIWAMLLSSIGFTFHHILVLGIYFGFMHWLTWLASFGVGVGGAYWCWSYRRFDTIWPAWISHGIIDVAIFVIGYLIMF